MSVKTDLFGTLGGRDVRRFTIVSQDVEVRLIELGATIQGLRVKDREGRWREVVLFHDSLEDYIEKPGYWGAVCGRHANRIAGAAFTLNGRRYQLEPNDNGNNLHSGKDGFHHKIFAGVSEDESSVSFRYFSPENEQGFPGNMFVKVTYRISDEGGLLIEYVTTTDEDTIWNLTNHAYFNLAGADTILDHTLQVAADFYTPVDDVLLPTGEILSVCGTPFDLRDPTLLRDRIGTGPNALKDGFDHNFVFRKSPGIPDATLYCSETGISMDVFTTLPGVQVYSAAGQDGTTSSWGHPVPRFGGICMETQFFPNSLSYAHFPQPIQYEGSLAMETTEYRFSIK